MRPPRLQQGRRLRAASAGHGAAGGSALFEFAGGASLEDLEDVGLLDDASPRSEISDESESDGAAHAAPGVPKLLGLSTAGPPPRLALRNRRAAGVGAAPAAGARVSPQRADAARRWREAERRPAVPPVGAPLERSKNAPQQPGTWHNPARPAAGELPRAPATGQARPPLPLPDSARTTLGTHRHMVTASKGGGAPRRASNAYASSEPLGGGTRARADAPTRPSGAQPRGGGGAAASPAPVATSTGAHNPAPRTGIEAVLHFVSGAGRQGERLFCNRAAALAAGAAGAGRGDGGSGLSGGGGDGGGDTMAHTCTVGGGGVGGAYNLEVVPQRLADPWLHYVVCYSGVVEMRCAVLVAARARHCLL